MWLAALNGNEDVMQVLLDCQRVDATSRSKTGRTALWRASSNGHLAAVKLLLGKGVDPNLPDNDGVTPLSEASKNGHDAVVQALVEKGANIGAIYQC